MRVLLDRLVDDGDTVHEHVGGEHKVVHALELELQAALIDIEHAGDAGVHVDGHVAQADGAVEVGVVEDGLLDHAGGVGEVDHPSLRTKLLDLADEVEDDGDGAEGPEHAAGAVGFLAEHAVGQRDALVEHAGGKTADADLGGHEVGAVECGAAVGREDDLGGKAGALDHALREGAHGVELILALGDVDEPQLIDGKILVPLDEALDELGRVARAAADSCDLDAVCHVILSSSSTCPRRSPLPHHRRAGVERGRRRA